MQNGTHHNDCCDPELVYSGNWKTLMKLYSDFLTKKEKQAYGIRRILNAITTKNFSQILRTVDDLLRLTVFQKIVVIRKLGLCRRKLIDLNLKRISLHKRYNNSSLHEFF